LKKENILVSRFHQLRLKFYHHSMIIRSRNYVNVIVAGKKPQPQWLTMDQAIQHCTSGIGIWKWASTDKGSEPDVVMACCGDVPTLETLAAVKLLHQQFPELKIRVINVVDLMTIQPEDAHPHGLPDDEFDDMISSVEHGLYAKKMGGGSVNPATGEFNFAVEEGYIIKNGRISNPVRGAALIGKGYEVLEEISMIGSDLEFAAGMCGAGSGMIPASVGQPTIKVNGILVGGH